MTVWFPGSIKSRALLVLSAAFLLSHAASLAIYETNREKTVLLAGATDLAARIIGIVNLARSFPQRDREQILAAAETRFLIVFPEPASLDGEHCRDNDFSARMSESLDNAFAGVPGFYARVCVRPQVSAPLPIPGKPLHGLDVLVSISFPDGKGALFHAFLSEGEPLAPYAVLVYSLLPSGAALLLAWYLIRRSLAPLEQLGRAADDIGVNIDTPPLPESGPREVVAAARAFNRMQHRLRRLVHGQTEMLAAISHDLRSAATRLQLRAELLRDQQESEGLLRVVADMRWMIQSVFDFVRGIEPNETPKCIDLTALVESLTEDLREEGYPVTFTYSEHPNILNCRPVAMRRGLQNIIDNAIEYGGSAQVSMEAEPRGVCIAVEDSGPGIPEDELSAVLRPFYRLDKSRNSETGGVGLGLSIARNIIQAHGGQLALGNRSGGGLRVEVHLPFR